MTKGEARELFLQYMGEAGVNGDNRTDPDLAKTFEAMLYPCIMQVASSFPAMQTAKVIRSWNSPHDLIEITRTLDDDFRPVAFTRIADRHFVFEAPCTVEYSRIPKKPDEALGDSAVIDLDERACQLVPIQLAIHAAAAVPEYAEKAAYLSASYNAIASGADTRHTAVFRRTMSI